MLFLSIIGGLICTVSAIILLIAAFKNAPWKGIAGFFCGLYLLYFGIVEYTGANKILLLLGYAGGLLVSVIFSVMNAANHIHAPTPLM